MISVHFQGKLLNITVIQVYAPTSNAEEAEVEWFYEDLQDLLELTLLTPPKNDMVRGGIKMSASKSFQNKNCKLCFIFPGGFFFFFSKYDDKHCISYILVSLLLVY